MTISRSRIYKRLRRKAGLPGHAIHKPTESVLIPTPRLKILTLVVKVITAGWIGLYRRERESK